MSALVDDATNDGVRFALTLLEFAHRVGVCDRPMAAQWVRIETRIAQHLEFRDAGLLEIVEFHDYETCTIV